MDNDLINITFTKEEIERIKIASRNYEPVLITRGEFSTIVFPEKPDHISTHDHNKIIKKFAKSLKMDGFKFYKTQINY